MLNPRTLTDAIVTTLKTNQALVDIVSLANIYAFHYNFAVERSLAGRIAMLPSPGVLVYWEATQGGNFNGAEIFRHRFCVAIRASSQIADVDAAVSYEDIWQAICNGAVNATQLNIRQISIVPEVDLMDTPSVSHMTDGENNDFFVGSFILPEIGDN